jgi:hypothetical protein
VAVLGAAGLGACAVLAACSPVQLGAAAIVGNQRITVSTVDTQVSNLQASVDQYNSTLQQINAELQQQEEELPVYATPFSRLVLNWQISFAIIDQMAATDSISVTQAQGQAALSSAAKENSVSTNVYLTAIGIPLQLSQQAGRYLAEETALEAKYGSNNTAALTKAQCTAAKSLNIQVSPQYGRFDYASSTMGLVAANETLSRPAGTPSPANTEGLTPAAC